MRRFVTPTREYFIDFFSPWGAGFPEVPPASPWAVWHGEAPRLNAPDGSARYAQHNDFEAPYNAPMAVIELPAGVDYTGATVHMQIRTTTAFYPRPFIAGPGAEAYGSNWQLDQGETAYPAGEWVTLSAVMDTWTASLDPSQPAIAGPGYVSDGVNDWDLSWLAVSVPGFIPTRVFPRADGLGMGAPRVRDGRSPYTSERVFGMI